MGLTPGTSLGLYGITGLLGAGGMGEVYRAHDPRLKREVALKIVSESFAADRERLARFQREAEVLASLNHPCIAAIYGLEVSDGMQALVLELVEGETLAERVARGAIPLDEALPIATQIAEALEAAHEHGIVHRDLKPANIKVRPDGTVKVLDFGLARPALLEAVAGHAEVTASPTITSPVMMTGVGVLLGTAAYMSPEQAKGRVADKRCDIWAFGCVLYEMLTGSRAFEGEGFGDTLANVLKVDPDWSALPPDIPPAIRTLVQSCLARDRQHRIADISTALFVLEKGASLAAPSASTMSTVPRPRRPAWRGAALTGVVLMVAAVATTLTWFTTRRAEPVPPRISRLAVAPSGGAALTINPIYRDLAITPDGSRIVYVGNGGTQLFVRALDVLEPVAVFTGAPRSPFFSPDGQWIGFVDGGTLLKKVAVTGGPAVLLAALDSGHRGATWGPDDTIIVGNESTTTGLQLLRVPGGEKTIITRPEPARGERLHVSPELLPGGRSVLFTITALTGGFDASQVAVLDLEAGTRKVLVRGASDAHYVPSGHLLYAAAGTLFAVSFDLARLETRGTPMPVVPGVAMTNAGGVDAVVASNGTLAYVPGDQTTGVLVPRTLVWVDRQGRETPIAAPPRVYLYPRLSSDGTRVALRAVDQERDIWIWDLERTRLTRTTFDPGYEGFPVWTPDGRRVIFNSDRAGARNLFWQAADGTGGVERLTQSPNRQEATAVSPDGWLIFTEQSPRAADDVMAMQLGGPRRVTPLVSSPFAERNGVVSPDGRWLAYETNESGQFEIYVRPFPEVQSGLWLVSTAGGTRPLWASDGQELFYVAPTGALMRVAVEGGQAWVATTPTQLFREGYLTDSLDNNGRTYDIAADGQRFLFVKQGAGPGQTAAPPQIIVLQNWFEELKRLVPVN